ncbi:MAG: TatD family hydrolase [Chloroflexota bacterium]|nr:TatD family hydrolase [Chloroflexota bacterium]
MKCIDPHIHMDSVNRAHLESMALAGMVAVIADAGPLPAPSAQNVLEFFDRTFSWDVPRAKEFLMEAYVTIGINMLQIPPDWPKVVEAMPKYLKNEKVVGIGEIGIDPRSFTTPDLNKQEEVLRAQLKVVADHNVPVVLHIPPVDKMMYLEKHFKRIEEFKLDKAKVVITHADGVTLKAILDFGCVAEMTMQPWRKFGPEEVAKLLKETKDIPLDRVLLDSDTAVRVASDVLSVPKAALELRKAGFKDADVEKIVYDNPRRVFKLK